MRADRNLRLPELRKRIFEDLERHFGFASYCSRPKDAVHSLRERFSWWDEFFRDVEEILSIEGQQPERTPRRAGKQRKSRKSVK
jgi:hypothetical protein